MNRYKLSKAGVSANEGIERFNGDKDLYEQVLLKFLTDKNYSMLCEAVENENIEEAFKAGHALKGIAGNLSMNRLFEDIVPMIETLRDGSFDNVKEQFEKVKEDYELIEAALQ